MIPFTCMVTSMVRSVKPHLKCESGHRVKSKGVYIRFRLAYHVNEVKDAGYVKKITGST